MGGIAVTLIRNNKRFLIGQAMSPEMLAQIVTHLRADPMVLNVIDPKVRRGGGRGRGGRGRGGGREANR